MPGQQPPDYSTFETEEPPVEEFRPPLKKPTLKKRSYKLLYWILIFLFLYLAIKLLSHQILALLQLNPTVWSIYQAVEWEIRTRSLTGLLYASFLGALFFITLPVEVIFIYYIQSTSYWWVEIFLVTLAGNLLGIIVDYILGWVLGPKLLQWFMKEKYTAFREKLERAGAFIVVIGNILPFPIELFTVVLGAVRYGFRRMLIYSALGKILKFGLLLFGYQYFKDAVIPYVLSLDLPAVFSFVQTTLANLL